MSLKTSKINQVVRYGIKMRENFDFKKYSFANWFPGHMNKGLNQMHRKMRNIDCVIEVHDARIPISGRNPIFLNEIGQIKPHILVLNKVDLISKNEKEFITQFYKKQNKANTKLLFTNCKDQKDKSIKNMTEIIIEAVKNSTRYHREHNNNYCAMIVGIPNVGKSSLINALRTTNLGKPKGTRVGADPGITRSVLQGIKISLEPQIFLMDTPGILDPKMKNIEDGLKLALVNTLKDHLVGEDIIADYLLYRLNYEGNHSYVEFLNLEQPTDNIQEALYIYALKNNLTQKTRIFTEKGGYTHSPHVLGAAKRFINAFRLGQFGDLRLDNF